jgi:hypothetical protein
VTEHWTFGAEPLRQTERAAQLLRRVTALTQSLEHEQPAVEGLIRALAEAESALVPLVPVDPAPRVGAAASGPGRVYLDHARDIGAFNPCFPEYDIEVNQDHAHGTVMFPIAYEGPPGIVHGGFLAVFFDCVVQHHNCDVGTAGKTTALALRYRRPVPLLSTLRFTVERSMADGRIHSMASLLADERVLCEADIDAVAGDRTALPEVSPRQVPS